MLPINFLHISTHVFKPICTFANQLPCSYTLSARTDKLIVIHDSRIGSVVQDAASIPNAETYAFQSVSAFASFFTIWEAMRQPFQTQVPNRLPSIEGCYNFEIMNFIAYQADFLKFRRNSNSKDKRLHWLDKQKPSSVIYVSFGTSTSMADEQIKELAIRLEESKVKFIWVLRDADKGDVFAEGARRAELPKGFEDRTKGEGMVVREWAPQMEILGHTSTGGFMSHCRWNSCMESISMRVPIAAWPMHSDQPMNAMLVTEVLKIGLNVREWANREEIVLSSTIKESIKEVNDIR
ncbi:hypothetical protein DITRI_Ditri12bG0104700 [Diplodiscus trichospermus]